jgi:hypothetical protein
MMTDFSLLMVLRFVSCWQLRCNCSCWTGTRAARKGGKKTGREVQSLAAGVRLFATTELSAATTATVAAATAAATTAAAAAVTAAAAATAARLFGSCFVDGHGAAVVLLIVHALNGFASGVVIAHFDEAESLAATGISVLNDFRAPHGSKFGKHFFELGAVDAVAQVSNIKLLTHN